MSYDKCHQLLKGQEIEYGFFFIIIFLTSNSKCEF